MPSGKKRKRHKMAVHKRKKRLRKNGIKRRNSLFESFLTHFIYGNKLKRLYQKSLFFVYKHFKSVRENTAFCSEEQKA